jgi:NAD+ synthetase
MKVFNDSHSQPLSPALKSILDDYREHRNFNVKNYVVNKTIKLRKYFESFNLKTAIIAVSGGIDSAVVLALAKYALNHHTIIPVCLPSLGNEGVTGQEKATSRGEEVIRALGLKPYSINLSPITKIIEQTLVKQFDIIPDPWSKGQLVPYLRTTLLYEIATLFTQNDQKAIILGTTNYDEGSYLGYFGKASDGLVDVQVISDIHKSEVYQVAKYLNLPDSVLAVTPKGDMFDNRSDEDVFGAPYDFVELYSYYLENPEDFNYKLSIASSEATQEFEVYQKSLEHLHAYNKHKYLGCSPAVHLDLLHKPLPNGWKFSVWDHST